MPYFQKILYVIIIAFVVSSCNHKTEKKPDFTTKSFPDSVKLETSEKYRNDSLVLNSPRYIQYHPDSFLIVQEVGTPFLLKIIDLKNGRVQQLIAKGTGKKQMVVAFGINLVGKTVTVFDGFLKKICMLQVDKNRRFDVVKEVLLKDEHLISGYPLSIQSIVGLSGIRAKERLVFFDGKGNVVKRIGSFPALENNDDIKSDNNIFHSQITFSNEVSKLALATTGSDILEIYSKGGKLIKRFQGPEGISLTAKKTDVGVGKITTTSPSFRGYNTILSNKDEFWAGYVGFKIENNVRPKMMDIMAKTIFCFSWDGKARRMIKFKIPFISFTVDWINHVVYCLTYTPSPEILIYRLSD